MSKRTPQPPGPSVWKLPHLLYEATQDTLEAFSKVAREYGEFVRLPLPGYGSAYVLSRPDDVQHVLQHNHKNYQKAKTYNTLRPLVGNGLLTSEGDYWLRQRRLVAPMFHRRHIAGFVDTIADSVQTMLKTWAESADSGAEIDLAAEMMRLTLGVAGRVLFSEDVSDSASEVGAALRIAFVDANHRLTSPFHMPMGVPTPHNLKVRKAIERLEQLVYMLIEERRGVEGEFQDLLSMLMAARDEDSGEPMTDVELRDEVMTFILAGHETTSNCLTWTLYLLSQHPDVRERLQREIDALEGDRITADTLHGLTYTAMVIQESLRLYPPAWTVERMPIEDDEIGGYPIPAGCVVMTAPFLVHHNPNVWEDPETFDPERFEPEKTKSHHRYAFFPFGGGPRKCVGGDFAIMEATLTLAMIARRFELSYRGNVPAAMEGSITLRPLRGMPMQLERR